MDTDTKFENAFEESSDNWEAEFPGHCYICHIANANEEDDRTINCGPHCTEINSNSTDIHD